MARFTREAQVLASLNRANIAAIYGVEERALVMELVDGPTLSDRITQGPIALDEALPIARQIAEALEYAHEHAIIHRDLKPANIKITPEGRVKALDFGLAKALENAPTSVDLGSCPTLTLSATRTGTLLGTGAYMSPEQARGTAADRRSDIWAFGAILYGMVTGRGPFAADTVSGTLVAVLKTDPDWSALPPDMPAAVRRLLRRALERDRKRRLPDIAAARLELGEALNEPPAPATPVASRWSWWPAAALAALAAGGTLGWMAARLVLSGSETRPLNVQIDPPAGTEFGVGYGAGSAISPDGRSVALVAPSGGISKLWVRPLDSAARELPGTEGAEFPFWSPDSHSLDFFAAGELKRSAIAGGLPVVITAASQPRGASWTQDGWRTNRAFVFAIPSSSH
jgi:serine/threonine-protein kinase